jgi:tripartite-type tricarboxylate transporter receptor subunit TctC
MHLVSENVMHLARRRLFYLAVCAVALPASARITQAQSYPSRPVRLIVGLAAGGGQDIVARLMGQWLSERLGRQLIVENRPGASGNLALEAVANAPADGHTLALLGVNNAINASLYNKPGFEFLRDIAPVGAVMRVPLVMVVNPSFPATTVPQFIAYAKARPGKITMGSGGVGTSIHVCGELFKMMTGVEMLHVPYRGGALALNDLIGGQLQVMFDTMPESIGFIRAGALRLARSDHGGARIGAAGRPHDRRFRTGLRGERVVRHRRATQYAGRDRRHAQPRDQRGLDRSEDQSAAGRAGWYALCRLARRVRQVHCRRRREVGQGDQVRRRQSALIAVRPAFRP